MAKIVKLKKGLNIRIKGEAEKILAPVVQIGLYGVKPVDFPGLVPKLCVKPDDIVKAGTPLFFNKLLPEIKFTSPVSGKVKSIVRGDRRLLLEVIVEASGDEFEQFGKADPGRLSREQIEEKILSSGLWPSIRQRPYNVIAKPGIIPKSIFISGFDTAPLAPDYDFIIHNTHGKYFQTGINAVSRLTSGKVNLVLNSDDPEKSALSKTTGVEIHYFSGPHPAGNVGVQIHHIDPVNKGEVVWAINIQDIVAIGRLFDEGIYMPEKIIALAGSEILKPCYHRVRSGASISSLLNNNLVQLKNRYISGNVLTGSKIEADGFLGYYDSMVTVIPEGDHFEFFGWIKPGFDKFSFSRSFPTWMMPFKKYRLDTNFHGGERAFVLTGLYEKVVPMDIYPMQLFKAIMFEDVELMEKLGIYEVAEEDFALCDFICPSKIEIQSVIRKGLDLMIKEMS